MRNRTDLSLPQHEYAPAAPRIPFSLSTAFRKAHHEFHFFWLIVGGLIDWLASMLINTNGRQSMFPNVVVGVVGAILVGLFISPMMGIGTTSDNNFSLPALALLFLGAALLLAIVNHFSRGYALKNLTLGTAGR